MIKVAGIQCYIHPLFVLVLLASFITGYYIEVAVLFGIVLVHEAGHVVAMKSFGWRIRRVSLLPFGGVAETDESGSVPAWQEAIVAAAGPAQNAFMCAFAYMMMQAGLWEQTWSAYFIQANTAIALFNLLPVSPLDGGKLVRVVVSLFLPYHRTLLICTLVSIFFSGFIIVFSVWNGLLQGIQMNLLAIGLFLFASNVVDFRHHSIYFLRFLMGREKRAKQWLDQGALARPIIVGTTCSLQQIVRMLMREKYHVVYVCSQRGRVMAIYPEQRVIRAFFEGSKLIDGENSAKKK